MHDREERRAGRVDAQSARPETDGAEAVRLQKRQLKGVPSALGPDGDEDPLVRIVDLVHAWRRFPWIDPGLPAQFLPAPWRGTAAAGLFARLHADWTGDAIAEWKQLLARA